MEVDSRDVKAGLMEVAIAILKAADRIAAALEAQAEAIAMRARIEAGEDDDTFGGFTSLGDR